MTEPNATVLIAEDDPVFRRVLSVAISKHGLKIEAVGDGLAAYQRIQQGGIDFLVLDHQMPLCSGIELLEQLSTNGKEAGGIPPTILCTAKGLELNVPELVERYQLVGILHKPFSPKQMSDLILKNLP
jgi:CheY-like chemotaxis protein